MMMMMMMMMTCAAVFVPWSRNTPHLEGWGGVLRDDDGEECCVIREKRLHT